MFSWKSNYTYTVEQSSKNHHNFGVTLFFLKPTAWKATALAYPNSLYFDQYPFNSRSNVHMHWVFWISLYPKRPVFLHFLDTKLSVQKPTKREETTSLLECWVNYVFFNSLKGFPKKKKWLKLWKALNPKHENLGCWHLVKFQFSRL